MPLSAIIEQKLLCSPDVLPLILTFKIYFYFGRANLLQTSWHYLTCPRENECSNGHHDCDPISEVCIDSDDGFSCDCNVGFNRTKGVDENSEFTCQPVCQSCVHGDCVKPGECRFVRQLTYFFQFLTEFINHEGQLIGTLSMKTT